MPPKKQKLHEDDPMSTKPTAQPRSRRTTRSTAQLPSRAPEVMTRKLSQEVGNSTLKRKDEEAGKERKQMGASLVKNVLALADTLGVKDGVHVDADQLLFLDTVRAMAIVPEVAMVPASDVYEKILAGIQETKSLQVTVASFRLLHDLDLRHPQVTVKATGIASENVFEFVDNQEHVWSPFERCLEETEEARASTKPTNVPTDLYMLLSSIADNLDGGPKVKISRRKDAVEHKATKNEEPLIEATEDGLQSIPVTLVQFLTLQWLVSLLDSDFQARQRVFQGNAEKLSLVQDSLIQRLLMGPYNQIIKKLFVILLRIIARLHKEDESEGEESEDEMEMEKPREDPASCVVDDQATASQTTFPNSCATIFVAESDFGRLATTLLSMILELDTFTDISDNRLLKKGILTGSLMENLMDTLQYERSHLRPLLQALENPGLKLRIILMYFVNHAPKVMREELRSIGTVKEMFDCVSKAKSAANVCVKFPPLELQLLLASAFQVFLEIHGTQQNDIDVVSREAAVTAVCNSLRAAFSNLRRSRRDCKEIHKTAECAIVVADMLSSP